MRCSVSLRRFYFYPRPPGGGRQVTALVILRRFCISIHALRVEGDRENLLTPKAQIRFLSTPSGWRATLSVYMWQRWCDLFLSTPSGWRATGISTTRTRSCIFLSTPSGWRATSILFKAFSPATGFLSTPSGWRATHHDQSTGSGCDISIHALRVEGDDQADCRCARGGDFYPRPPGGGRPPLLI